MKRILKINTGLTLIFVCSQLISWSQISFGYRSHFGGMKSYKEIMQYYNENRPWLDKEISSSAYMHGYEIGFGGSFNKAGYTLGRFYGQFGKSRAKGTDLNGDFTRIVRTRIFGIEPFDIWWTPLSVKQINIGFGVMPLGLQFFKIDTYLKEDGFERLPILDVPLYAFKESYMYVNLHLDFTFVKDELYNIHLQFFYTIGPPQKHNLYHINRELNPNTYSSFNRRTLMKVNNFGMKLILSI